MAKSYEKWCRELINYVVNDLNLLEWEFHISYDDPVPDGDNACTGWTHIDSRYLTAYIHFTPLHHERWLEEQYADVAFTIVHEITHVLVDPLHKFALPSTSQITREHLTDLVEQSVQRISRIVMKNIPKKFLSV